MMIRKRNDSQEERKETPGVVDIVESNENKTKSTSHSVEEEKILMSMDEILLQIGFKTYHKLLFAAFAVMTVADAMEVTLISFLSPCAQEYWQLSSTATGLMTASSYCGNFFGALVLGRLADVYGRQPITTVSLAVTVISGWLTAISPSYPFLLVFRFFVGVGVAGSVIPYDLCLELIPITKRGSMAFLTAIWGMGSMFVAGIAWVALDALGWRWVVGLCTIPMCCLLLTARMWPESPRWLLSQGRDKEAMEILTYIAYVSNVPLDDRIVLKPIVQEDEEHYSYFKLFSKGVRGTTGVVSSIFLLWGFAYTATILTVTSAFEEESRSSEVTCTFDYGDIFLSASAEIFGGILLLILAQRYGRKKTQYIFYFSAAFTVILVGAGLPKAAMVAFAVLTRGASNSATGGSWMAAPEQFPTEIRGSAHTFVYIWSRVGGTLGSFTWGSLNLPLIGQTLLIAVAQILVIVPIKLTKETSNKALDEPDSDKTVRSLESANDLRRYSTSMTASTEMVDIKNMLV
mmetsp:Transcript_20034/g.26452  ORF Transcript_20034/g.26452 Transcript_20034/m.26452 type:complete len:517 (-) Transcript_20034:207-1757(-)